ncbi:hypothetical protein KCP75_10835 [Salmonella enterica subsp. enterica]|nr:hypothetical protein KCP75_10835 [Salmonella enterica subsp. enterica]
MAKANALPACTLKQAETRANRRYISGLARRYAAELTALSALDGFLPAMFSANNRPHGHITPGFAVCVANITSIIRQSYDISVFIQR